MRAYATNGAGTAYGLQESFTTSAGELTWDGSESTDWHTAANWDGNVVPTAGYNVLIPAGLTNYPVLSAAGECNNLSIESSSSSTGSLLGQGYLVVHGSTTVEQYLTGNAWHLVSSPAPGQTLSSFLSANTTIPVKDVSGTNRKGMMDYNEPINNWNSFFLESGQTGNLESGKGFSLRTTSGGVVSYTGSLATGIVSATVINSGTYGWNCVGNPYPSAIFINSDAHSTNNFIGLNTENLDPSYAAVYVWEQGSGTYSIIGQSDAAYYAQAGQAFMVKVKTGVSGIDFTTAMQTQQPDVLIKSGTLQSPELKLTASMGGTSRTARIRFNDAMSTGLDIGYDAGVFKTGFNIYTKLIEDNGVDFGLQSLPETGMEAFEIPVGIDATTSGEISISLKKENFPSEITPVLTDNLTGRSFIFGTEGDIYTSAIDGSQGYGRFTLKFASTTGTENNSIPRFKAWYSEGYIYISGEMGSEGEAAVYDLNGRKVARHQLEYSTLNKIEAPVGANGIYLVRIKDSKRSEVLKVPVVGR